MMIKILRTFALEVWGNPKEGWELFKMLGGAFITFIVGAICFGCVECYEKVLDKLKKD